MTEKDVAERLMTRRAVVKFCNDEMGIPLKESTLDKLMMRGLGPKPDAFYGRTELFKVSTVAGWATERLCTDKPTVLGAH